MTRSGLPAAPDQVVHVNGLDIAVSVRGQGRPLLLIMGLGGNRRMWEPLERELIPRGVQTITFDAPGVGASTGWTLPHRMPSIAGVAAGIITALGHTQVDVLGVSLGGAIAQQLAHQAPHRVRKLILAATMPGIGGVPATPDVLLKMCTPRRYRDPTYFRKVAGSLYGGRSRTAGGSPVHDDARRFAAPPSYAGYFGQLFAITGWTSLPWLHWVHHRTLVMAGDDDPIVPLANSYILTWCIPQAHLHVMHGGGHLFLLEEPQQSATVITHFLHHHKR